MAVKGIISPFGVLPKRSAAGGTDVTPDGDTSSQTSPLGSTTLTFAHTVNSRTNNCLFVLVYLTSNNTISSVTFNGDAMTVVGTVTLSTTLRVSIYRRVAPDVGSFNVVVTLAVSDEFGASAHNFYNVNQTTPTGGTSTASETATSSSIVRGSAVGEIVLDGIAVGIFNPAAGAGQTEISDITYTAVESGASREAGAASVTMSWSWGVSEGYAHIVTDINKA